MITASNFSKSMTSKVLNIGPTNILTPLSLEFKKTVIMAVLTDFPTPLIASQRCLAMHPKNVFQET